MKGTMKFNATRLLLVVVALSICAIGIAEAQGKRGGKRGERKRANIEKRVAHLTERLALNEEQAAQITTILEDNAAGIAADREQFKDDRAKMREARKQRIEALDGQIEQVLTEEQVQKYREMQAERRERRSGKARKRNQTSDSQ